MDPRIPNGVIFLDAAQRYRAALEAKTLPDPTDQKGRLAFLERLLRDACNESPLFEGPEKEVMGESWARFLHSRKAERVEAFVTRLSSPEWMERVGKFQEVAQLNREYQHNPKSIVSALLIDGFLSLGKPIKDLVEDSKMIDTKNEHLSGILGEISAEIRKKRGLPPPKPLNDPSETASGLPASLIVAAKKNEVFRG